MTPEPYKGRGRRAGSRNGTAAATAKEATRLQAAGVSQSNIALALGISRRYVYEVLKPRASA